MTALPVPPTVARHLPGLRETVRDRDPWVQAQLRCPKEGWQFFAIEFERGENLLYGRLIQNDGKESDGDFSLEELQNEGVECYWNMEWVATRISRCHASRN